MDFRGDFIRMHDFFGQKNARCCVHRGQLVLNVLHLKTPCVWVPIVRAKFHSLPLFYCVCVSVSFPALQFCFIIALCKLS